MKCLFIIFLNLFITQINEEGKMGENETKNIFYICFMRARLDHVTHPVFLTVWLLCDVCVCGGGPS